LVLKDNYSQAWILGYLAKYALSETLTYQAYIKELASANLINRAVEYLPDDKTILERKTAGIGLLRPELAVLLAYTKIVTKNELLKSDLPEDPFFIQMLETAFPNTINKAYYEASRNHILKREIIATQLSSNVINEMGIVFIYRLQNETGATVSEIVRAHAAASAIFNSKKMQRVIELLDFKIPIAMQYELLFHIRHLVNISTRWFLHSKRLDDNISQTIEHYAARVKILDNLIVELMTGSTKVFLGKLREQFLGAGLTEELANQIASFRVAYTALNIIEIATKHNFDLEKTARTYFLVGENFNLVWFRDHIANDMREGSWNSMARLTLRDQLDVLQKGLTVNIMKAFKKEENVLAAILHWKTRHAASLIRWEKMLAALHESSTIDYSMFFITLSELMHLIEK
ncbi:MAG TPA: NAD-glutamate dehydrogenase, partial [Gammaproteobacteria bacterium]|nr:NAD-glutamate dehydrogenase [Gammaproteobacteria bacterium]